MGNAIVCLVRPMTFMNLSGRAVSALLRHFDLSSERTVVVYDEMDLAVARVQVKPFGGSGSHNGLKSLLEHVGKDFPRVRIGIGKPTLSGVDHVLSHFDREEIPEVRNAIERAADACEAVIEHGVENAMNLINLPQ
jgi:PTH1 family peptidyl-tRNA hydrolase